MSPCEGSQSYHNFRSAFEQEVSETLRTIHGCYNSKACVMEEVAVPGCGWTVNQRSRGVVADSKDVLFSLSVKAYDSASTEDDVEEKSEAILFQMQYAISTGQFIITLDNMNSTVNRSSFEHVSSDVICYPGFVEREDRMGCGKWRKLSIGPSLCEALKGQTNARLAGPPYAYNRVSLDTWNIIEIHRTHYLSSPSCLLTGYESTVNSGNQKRTDYCTSIKQRNAMLSDSQI